MPKDTPEARRRSEARQAGEDLDVAFFEANPGRAHRIRAAMPFEFGQEGELYAISRLRDDFIVEAAPLQIEKPIPDIDGLVGYLWGVLDLYRRSGGSVPISVPISDDLIVEHMKARARG